MKNILWIISLFMCSLLQAQTVFYVSTRGKSSGNGTSTKPFASLNHAVEAARNIQGDVTVYLRGGTYYLPETIIFMPVTNRSTLAIRSYPGEKVCISGGIKLQPEWTKYKDNIYQALLPQGITIDQLVVNGELQRMARYPNYDPNAIRFGGTAADAIAPERVQTWKNPVGGFLHAMHKHDWGDFHYIFTGKNEQGELQMDGGWQNNRPYGLHPENLMVENIFEELDALGEWYFDNQTNTLYYYPGENVDIDRAVIEIPQLKHLFEFRGTEKSPVSNITIDGITFTHTLRTFMEDYEPLLRSDWTVYRGGALLIEGAEDISITNCDFYNLGGNGIFFSRYNKSHTVSGCHLYNIGASAVCFVGDASAVRSPHFNYDQEQIPIEQIDLTPGPLNNNYPQDCRVHDNLIHSIGMVEKQITGVELSMCRGITVSHNSIYDVPRAAVNISEGTWGGHIIEFNDLFDTVKETGDHGSFNSWGRDRFWMKNLEEMRKYAKLMPALILADAIETNVIRNNRIRCDRGWDIDLDDGSSNYLIYNNLCLNGGIKLREGFNRVVENNIILNNTLHPHIWFDNSGDIFARNIVMRPYAPIGVDTWGLMIDYNVFSDSTSYQFARLNGLDAHSIVEKIPFYAPQSGDFRVKEDSKTIKHGFLNFPMDRYGVVSQRLKVLSRTPVIPVIDYSSASGKEATIDWKGLRIKNLDTLGERSATGMDEERGIYIVSVASDSEFTGLLKANDVILQYNSVPVNKLNEFVDAVASGDNGVKIKFGIFREQNHMIVSVPE